MNKLLILLGIGFVVAACDNVGGGGSVNAAYLTAQVTSGNCSENGNGMVSGESCTITLKYGNMGSTGTTLSSNPSPESFPLTMNNPLNPTFTNTFNTCKQQMSSSGSGECPIVITYNNPLGALDKPKFDLTFTAVTTDSAQASVTSNSTTIQGQ